jgi:hypothetical protein
VKIQIQQANMRTLEINHLNPQKTLYSKVKIEPGSPFKDKKMRLETDVISEEISKSPAQHIWKIDEEFVKKS